MSTEIDKKAIIFLVQFLPEDWEDHLALTWYLSKRAVMTVCIVN